MSVPHNRTYREFFFACKGLGPWECWVCGDIVDFSIVHIHHIDKNRENGSLENLAPCHSACHNYFHKTGTKHTEKSKAQIRKSVRDHVDSLSAVERKKYANGVWSGRKHSAETIKKLQEIARNRPPMRQETRDKISKAGKGRKRSIETRKKMAAAATRAWEIRKKAENGS